MKPITWEVKTRIFGNGLLWLQLVFTALLSSGFVFLLLLFLNLYEEQWQEIPSSFTVWAVLAGFLFVLFFLVFMLISRGITTVYTVNDEGVRQHTRTTYGKWVKWLSYFALFFGGMRGAQAAVSVNMARTREDIHYSWEDISSAVMKPGKHEIHLRNKWRVLIQLICLPENFHTVREMVAAHVTAGDKPRETTSGLSRLMGTLLTLVLGALLFPRLPVQFVGIFTILLMIGTLFSIWSTGMWKKAAALASVVVIVTGLILAAVKGTSNFHSEGYLYALGIQGLILLFFFALNIRMLFKSETQ